MESNFQWKIFRQSQNDNGHILLVSVELVPDVEMTSKKIFRSQADVACTPHFFGEKFVTMINMSEECTEKVQAWKLFYDKTLFLE
jgi:hypothetical protein